MPATGRHVFYLPHHAVIRPEKSTTKLRVVMDGAAHAPQQQPVNHFLFKGFVDYYSLDALTKFRLGKTAVCADVEKAFNQISIHPDDRDAVRFIWFDEFGKQTVYRFIRVPFGLSSSPFQLSSVIRPFTRHKDFQFIL